MVTKFIRVFVKPGHMDAYLAAQEIWNRETASAPGFLGSMSGRDPNEPDVVYLQFFWRSHDDLERWMTRDHDRIAALARADELYERIEVRHLESLVGKSVPFRSSVGDRASEASEN